MSIKSSFRTAILVACLAFYGCSSDSEEDLFPQDNCTTDVTFSDNIQPIIQSNCISCHNNQTRNGNVSLEGYSNVKSVVDSGKLPGVVRWDAGFVMMPQGQPKIADCDIKRIETWIGEGAPNN